MKVLKVSMVAMLLQLCVNQLYAQGEVPVNMYTGTANIEIPLWNVTSRELSDMVSLTYNTQGTRLFESNGQFGVCWNVTGGGSIRREVRGLPDDYTGIGADQRRGWLYQIYNTTTYLNQDIVAIPNTSDLSAATCADEVADYNKINSYGYNNDTQPDIFHYNAGGLSGSFVFDNTAAQGIRLIPYRDIKITPFFVAGTKNLQYFQIITNTGVIYEFQPGGATTRYTQKTTANPSVEFLKTDFELYALTAAHNYKKISYTDNWALYQVRTVSGDRIDYGYTTESITSTDEIKALVYSGIGSAFLVDTIYQDFRTRVIFNLASISSIGGTVVDFEKTDGLVTSVNIKDRRVDLGLTAIKKFDITYHLISHYDYKSLISKIQEVSATDSLPPYKFDYIGTQLPYLNTKGQDFWGYSNGKINTHMIPTLYVYPALRGAERIRFEKIQGYSGTEYIIPGANRDVDVPSIQFGTLQMITYPWGGTTTLAYESNQYLDPYDNQPKNGGGLRVKSMAYYDGLTSKVKIEKSFAYTDSTGQCSGRLISKPVFGLTTLEYRNPNDNTNKIAASTENGNWTKFVVGFENDLTGGYTTQGSVVGYTEVKVFRPGAGYARFQFEMPGVYRDSVSGLWSATVNKFARQTPCGDMNFGSTQSGINSFPYAPNPDFGFSQGLVKRKRSYDNNDVLVENINYTYQYIGTPYQVWGLNFERYPNSIYNVFYFGKYFMLTDVARVPKAETVTTYDAANSSKNITQSTEYIYGSNNHKSVTQVKSSVADGTVYRTYSKYPLDYGTIPTGADKTSAAIGILQTTFRNGSPIEQYRTIQKPGKTEKIIDGSIIKFSDFGTLGKVLPESSLAWHSTSPDSTYTVSYVDPVTKQFKNDNDYEVEGTILSYGTSDQVTSSVGQSRITSTTIWGYDSTTPIIQASDMLATQFAFSDFETTTSSSFTASPNCAECLPEADTIGYGAGRTGNKSISFSQVILSTTLQKGGDKYIFSGWVKHSGSPVGFTVALGPSTHPFFNQNLTFTPKTPASTFEYFEFEIPITGGTSFFVEIKPYGGGSWYLDDVALYPAKGSMTSYTYQFPFGTTSVTSRDRSSQSTYDGLGRVKYVKDKDGNFLMKKVYNHTEN